MRKERRSRHIQKLDQKARFGNMVDKGPRERAKAQMQHKPYAAMLIREQGQQMEGREHGESTTTERKEI